MVDGRGTTRQSPLASWWQPWLAMGALEEEARVECRAHSVGRGVPSQHRVDRFEG